MTSLATSSGGNIHHSTSSSRTSTHSTTNSNSNPSSSSSQQPQISLLGTLPFSNLSPLLLHINSHLTTLSPHLLYQRETVLSRHDDETSQIREKHDNAWAAVVRTRRSVRLRVRESLENHLLHCQLFLPLPPLPERQYPRITVRPTVTVKMLSDPIPIPATTTTTFIQPDPFSTQLSSSPSLLPDTDPQTGWKSFTSSIGWKPSFSFLRIGLVYHLDTPLVSSSSNPTTSSATFHPLQPRLKTCSSLLVYRLFHPDITPIDGDGSTVIVEFIATVGGQLDPRHFLSSIAASPPSDLQRQAGGLDSDATIENAIKFAQVIAKSFRGLVDLRRENTE